MRVLRVVVDGGDGDFVEDVTDVLDGHVEDAVRGDVVAERPPEIRRPVVAPVAPRAAPLDAVRPGVPELEEPRAAGLRLGAQDRVGVLFHDAHELLEVSRVVSDAEGRDVAARVRGLGDGPEPVRGGVDEDNLLAYCPMGDRLRVTATADFAGFDTTHAPEDFTVMLGKARELFPDGADYEQPSYWAGLRPMTPEGTPILGRARIRNLWFNTGHGHMGWTMAAGTARITADLIAGRTPEIDMTGLTLG